MKTKRLMKLIFGDGDLEIAGCSSKILPTVKSDGEKIVRHQLRLY